MPTTYAHYKFGVDVLQALPGHLRQAIEKNRELYNIGLHGPDIFFYSNALFNNYLAQLGHKMHHQPGRVFFEDARKRLDKTEHQAAVRAYLYGFICHFSLDSQCHPYVEKMMQTSGVSHHEIEMEFDRYLELGDGIFPATYLRTKHIVPSKKNGQIIAQCFDKVEPEKITAALKNMIRIHKLLLANRPGKIAVLSGLMKALGIHKKMYGLIVQEHGNPKCEKYNLILKKTYAQAVPQAVSLIIQFQKALYQDTKLPQPFDATFDHGSDWEKLHI